MASPKVQHVSKAASDRLLVKFSDVSAYDFVYNETGVSSPKAKKNSKKKRAAEGEEIRTQNPKNNKNCNSISASRELDSIVTWKTPLNGSSTVRMAGVRSVGNFKSSQMTVAKIKTYALFSAAAEKAWRKALRGASKFLMDKRTMQPVLLRKELL